MAGLAAITFTEAAAAELRDRVRRDLEYVAEDDKRRRGFKRYRCGRAVLEMDAASIQTLHSFAQSLLRELPLEAGLPPGFELLDPIESDLRFQQAWDQWLDESLESTELGPKLARALHLGLNLDQLRGVASELNGNYDLSGSRTHCRGTRAHADHREPVPGGVGRRRSSGFDGSRKLASAMGLF